MKEIGVIKKRRNRERVMERKSEKGVLIKGEKAYRQCPGPGTQRAGAADKGLLFPFQWAV